MSMFIDFHVLQTVPPSCVNRDDTGSPKTAVYGGAVRARVSSQSWKRAMRVTFRSLFETQDLGIRTKHVVDMVMQEMLAMDPTLDEQSAEKRAIDVLEQAGLTIKTKAKEKAKAKERPETDALFFMSHRQAQALAKLACEEDADKGACKKALIENPSVDIALFGRMAASDKDLNVDATSQVAHAISTHAVQNEFDYFTAVDDFSIADNAGAGHLGTVEFNSSTLYRYANINAEDLMKCVGRESVPAMIRKFAEAFVLSMPTGKENTFANRTFPDAVYVTIRSDQPVNLCGAFECPVRCSENGYAAASEQKLVDYAQTVYTRYAAKPDLSLCIGKELAAMAQESTLPELLDALEIAVRTRILEA